MDAKRLLWLCIVLLFATLAVTAPIVIIRENVGEAEPEAVGGSQVTMARLAFSPQTLTVRRGTEVLFDNQDVAPHTVTARSGDADSGIINPGRAFRLIIDEPLDYFCAIHPSMEAKIELSG